MSNHKRDIIIGFMYTFLEKVGAQGISFVVSIILARLLLPSEYGVLALALIFVQLCDVIITYGFSNSLVVKQDSDNVDFSTCFYFSIGVSIVFYCFVWIISPYIANFFSQPMLQPLLRFMGLRLPIVAVNSVQQAYVSKNMKFKLFFISTISGAVTSGIIGISLAYMNYGVWALAWQSLSNTIVYTLVLWFVVKWRPILVFSFDRLKFIYSYGWKILATGLIDTLYSQMRDLVIGKKYSASDLAYYNRGNQFPTLGMNIIEPVLANVMFPALARANGNYQEMLSILRRSIKLVTYVIFPFFAVLACVAKPLILLLLTEKWSVSIVFLQLGCLALFLRPIQVINSTMIRASGRSGLLLKLDVYKKGIGLILLFCSIPFGIIAIVWSAIISNLISTCINIMPNRKVFKYGYRLQVSDMLPNFLIALLMGIPTYLLQCCGFNNFWTLSLQILVGISIYIVLSIVTRNESYKYLVSSIKNKLIKQ